MAQKSPLGQWNLSKEPRRWEHRINMEAGESFFMFETCELYLGFRVVLVCQSGSFVHYTGILILNLLFPVGVDLDVGQVEADRSAIPIQKEYLSQCIDINIREELRNQIRNIKQLRSITVSVLVRLVSIITHLSTAYCKDQPKPW